MTLSKVSMASLASFRTAQQSTGKRGATLHPKRVKSRSTPRRWMVCHACVIQVGKYRSSVARSQPEPSGRRKYMALGE